MPFQAPYKWIMIACILVGCSSSGTSVYDDSGSNVGRVVVESAERATVYDISGSRVGTIDDEDVFNRSGSRVGSVNGDKIFNRSGSRVGRISSQTNCTDSSGSNKGRIAVDIDDEAAGGACLLLLLIP